jgi:seryl-tRNA synthetase
MSPSTELVQGLELRDPTGSKLGVFVPEPVLRDLLAERDALRKQLAEEQARLREVEKERDAYMQSIYHLTRKDFENHTFTEEDLREMEKNGVTGEQILREIEAAADLDATPILVTSVPIDP